MPSRVELSRGALLELKKRGDRDWRLEFRIAHRRPRSLISRFDAFAPFVASFVTGGNTRFLTRESIMLIKSERRSYARRNAIISRLTVFTIAISYVP